MKIPKGWQDITIEQYQALCNNIADNSLNELELIVSNITVLCGVDYAQVEKMPLGETFKINKELEFIKSVPDNKAINDVIIEDKVYSLYPDIHKMSYGQFKALNHYTKDKEKINDNLHYLMAVFIYEKGKDYIIDFEDRAELFRKHLTMNVVFPLSSFFLQLLIKSVEVTQTYSMEKAMKIAREQIKEATALIHDSDGLN